MNASDCMLVNHVRKPFIWGYLIRATGRRIVQSQGVFLNKTKPTLNVRYIPMLRVTSEPTIQVLERQKTLPTRFALRRSCCGQQSAAVCEWTHSVFRGAVGLMAHNEPSSEPSYIPLKYLTVQPASHFHYRRFPCKSRRNKFALNCCPVIHIGS